MSFCILKDKIRDLLAEKLAENIVDARRDDLVKVLRYNSLGGFEILDDGDLIENLIVYIPEFEMLNVLDSDSEKFVFQVSEQFLAKETSIIENISVYLKIIYFT